MNRPAARPRSRAVAILQSNYIPWKGYFDLMNSVDEFVLYDDAQYTTNDWRNRNRIRTPQGTQWLTIPVATHGRFGQPIREACATNGHWRRRHWAAISLNYAKAPHFGRYRDVFEPLYVESDELRLSAINRAFIDRIAGVLGIATRLSWSMDYALEGDRNQRLIGLCRQLGADRYVSGPAARAYLDADAFAAAGIAVSYFDYSGYPRYSQQSGEFIHEVSVLDLIFNEGPQAPLYMKSFPSR